ncbi:MAG: pyridoxal phosphate-dependent aminotransferase [Proteobacteria bacterium]|nr:pyridoxal phosphate-dependent aminotransferase [Pseudomonadota bacterium]MBU4298245.1 pyridoxal phosphate-dependent aminotransferase [Pseudomonadota bacterium]MCG2747513.1 pyridoxal phosphate-dependent aminotransferase [Desulfobulbaceae bacterium]
MGISKKMNEFATASSWIRKMFEEGAKLKKQFGAENVFDFSLGNPDVPPPPQFDTVLQKIAADNAAGVHSYMPNGGYPFVREAVAGQISAEQTMQVGGDDILMTCGAAGALNVVLKAILNPDEEIIILAPFFVEYKFYIDNQGGKSVVVPTNDDFSLDLAAIEGAITTKTKAIIINSPNNPTGQIYPEKDLQALGTMLSACQEKFGSTIFLLSDEPYRKIIFDDQQVPSIFQSYPNSIVVSSYSKDLSLPGERIGYIAVHPRITEKNALLAAMTLANRILGFVNAPALMQRVIAELQGVTVDTSIYARRRKTFCDILTAVGFAFTPPKGAFYIFPKTPISDDVQFVAHLQKYKILAVPGRGFGMPGYIRLAFCVDDDVIARSASAFKQAMDTLGEA